MDDRAAGARDLVAAVAAVPHIELEAPQSLGPDAGDAFQDRTAAPAQLDDQPGGPGRGDNH
eukprot:8601944-Alexandrium_andersonii.AAC.1